MFVSVRLSKAHTLWCRSVEDGVHQSDISINQSGLDHTSLSSGPDQSLASSVSGSSHSAAQEGWSTKDFYSGKPLRLLL